jgi:hypothetical protein
MTELDPMAPLDEPLIIVRQFIEKCEAEAHALGLQGFIVAGTMQKAGHDHWWGTGFGYCLTMLGLIHELERGIGTKYGDRVEPPKKAKPRWFSRMLER